jgi:L-ascorbate metabolism protein UlaG (beta-lactamase superfamily)
MFDIEYKGGNGVVITTKKTTLVADPKLSLIGLRDLVAKNVIELATEARFALNDKDALINIESPGEYEIGDFSIHGIGATRHLDAESDEQRTTIYRIEVGDVRIALIGNISPIKLTEEQLENIGLIDILIVPVGGNGYTLDATSAVSLLRQIDPKVVIPVHYADGALKYEVAQDSLETFVKELGAPVETLAKYKVKSAASLPPTLTLIELTRS